MSKLQQYIIDHREEFDKGSLPEGSKARLMQKLDELPEEKSGRARIRYMFISAAAAIILFVFLMGYRNASAQSEDYMAEIRALESEIADLSLNCDPKTAKEIIKASKAVINEATPLEKLLPEEISKEERRIILERYYTKKANSLTRIKDLLAARTMQ